MNLVLERPLSSDQVTQMQSALSEVNFYDHELTGKLDDATLQAVASWAEHRSSAETTYRFLRTAITLNLFDGMNVFQPE